MITLDATSTLRAIAGTGTALTMTVFGDEFASNANSFKKLYQGQVATSVTTVYTVPSSTQALIRTILVVNTTGSAVTFGLYTDGTAASNKITGFTIPANGEAVYSADGWKVLDANGALTQGVADGSLTSAKFGSDIFQTGFDAWQTYTPTWAGTVTNPAIGNGTIVGSYIKIARLVIARGVITMGSTTTYGSGGFVVGLPVAASVLEAGAVALGPVACYDSSAATRFARQGSLFSNVSSLVLAEAGTLATSTNPMTWASGDILAWKFTYESAS